MAVKNIDSAYIEIYKSIYREILNTSPETCFDEAALPSYTHSNQLMSYLFWKRLNMSLRVAGDIRNCSVLDFGCGGAVIFKYLQDNNCTITGCENQFLELTEQVSNYLSVNPILLKDLFDACDKYDTIFALDVLEHVDDLEKYLVKLASLLKEGGQMIISGPTENFLYKIGRTLAGFSGHYHVRNIYQIEKALTEAGLLRIQLKRLFPVFEFFRISAWKKTMY